MVICLVCNVCKGMTVVDIGAGFITILLRVCVGAGYGMVRVGDVVHCSFTSCLPTLCPLLPRITPRLLKICHDVGGAVVLWCGGAVVVVLTSAGPAPVLLRAGASSSVLRRSAACSRGDTHGDV